LHFCVFLCVYLRFSMCGQSFPLFAAFASASLHPDHLPFPPRRPFFPLDHGLRASPQFPVAPSTQRFSPLLFFSRFPGLAHGDRFFRLALGTVLNPPLLRPPLFPALGASMLQREHPPPTPMFNFPFPFFPRYCSRDLLCRGTFVPGRALFSWDSALISTEVEEPHTSALMYSRSTRNVPAGELVPDPQAFPSSQSTSPAAPSRPAKWRLAWRPISFFFATWLGGPPPLCFHSHARVRVFFPGGYVRNSVLVLEGDGSFPTFFLSSRRHL